MKFKCRHVRPTTTRFASIEATCEEEAANVFHLQCAQGILLLDGTGARFSIVEVEGVGKFISRVFFLGIGRKGGLKAPKRADHADDLAEVAAKLGVSVEALEEGEWEEVKQEYIGLGNINSPQWVDAP